MAKKSKTPTITRTGFDSIATAFKEALRKWWQDEAQSFDAAVAGTASVWEGMPEIDSKAVVKASPIVRKFIGCDLDPRLIKRGGYSSFNDFWADLGAKLRDSCPTTLSTQSAAGTNAEELESINVRRS